MNKIYAIQWKSKLNGRAGRGTKLFEREEADRLAEELNHEHPQIEHEVVQAQPEGEEAPQPPPALEPTFFTA